MVQLPLFLDMGEGALSRHRRRAGRAPDKRLKRDSLGGCMFHFRNRLPLLTLAFAVACGSERQPPPPTHALTRLVPTTPAVPHATPMAGASIDPSEKSRMDAARSTYWAWAGRLQVNRAALGKLLSRTATPAVTPLERSYTDSIVHLHFSAVELLFYRIPNGRDILTSVAVDSERPDLPFGVGVGTPAAKVDSVLGSTERRRTASDSLFLSYTVHTGDENGEPEFGFVLLSGIVRRVVWAFPVD